MKKFVLTFAALLFATTAFAQGIPNPTKAIFEVSPDHTATAVYEIGYFLAGAAEPVQIASLGSFAAVTYPGVATAPIDVKPLAFSGYTAKVRLTVSGMTSEWSAPSNPFGRVPLPPGNVNVER